MSFEESKVKRDESGKFSKQEGGSGARAGDKAKQSAKETMSPQDVHQYAPTTELNAEQEGALEDWVNDDNLQWTTAKALRSGKELSGDEKYLVDTLDEAFARAKTTEEFTTYRGLKQDFSSLEPGASLSDKSFASTSSDVEVAKAYALTSGSKGTLLEITVPKGSRALSVKDYAGARASNEEILLDRNSKYTVTGKRNDGGQTVLTVTLSHTTAVGNSIPLYNLPIILYKQANRKPIQWRIDEDGIMRITMRVLEACVAEYGREEIPAEVGIEKDIILEYIPSEEFNKPEAIASLEGKPVIVSSHEWRDVNNVLSDGLTVGAIAGTPYVKDDGLYADALIFDKTTQEAIQAGVLTEVSAAYLGDFIVGEGTFNGAQYDATQANLRFNHVLLLPPGCGRLGADVKIVNKVPETKMPEKIASLKVQIGNTARTFRFSNEEDRAEAESMLEEQKKFNAEELQTSIEEKQRLEKQIEELKAQLAEHDKHLEEAKKELERLLSSEVQEALAVEAAEQRDDEDAIVADVVETRNEEEGKNLTEEAKEEEKAAIANSIRKGSFADRRRNAVALAFANQKMEVPTAWTQAAVDGAFEMLVMNAKQRNAARAHQQTPGTGYILNGKKTAGNNVPVENSNRARMLRPMRALNEQRKESK